jgi:predicted membrane channel-forming protein YqfA (hemolysin III family)
LVTFFLLLGWVVGGVVGVVWVAGAAGVVSSLLPPWSPTPCEVRLFFFTSVACFYGLRVIFACLAS